MWAFGSEGIARQGRVGGVGDIVVTLRMVIVNSIDLCKVRHVPSRGKQTKISTTRLLHWIYIKSQDPNKHNLLPESRCRFLSISRYLLPTP